MAVPAGGYWRNSGPWLPWPAAREHQEGSGGTGPSTWEKRSIPESSGEVLSARTREVFREGDQDMRAIGNGRAGWGAYVSPGGDRLPLNPCLTFIENRIFRDNIFWFQFPFSLLNSSPPLFLSGFTHFCLSLKKLKKNRYLKDIIKII